MFYRSGMLMIATGMLWTQLLGCSHRSGKDAVVTIRVEGSDTMVNIAQAWAEFYHHLHPEVRVQVLGGGSGVGIASLIDGNCDIANSSRTMKEDEIEKATAKYGVKPKAIIVGYDALALYVHKDNPIDTISLEQLAEIYGWGGRITRWSQLGVDLDSPRRDTIVRVSRQAGCGTYSYFREAVLGERRNPEYKLGSVDQSGSKAVVTLVSKTPSAIGYSGMGYATADVKLINVSRRTGEPGTAPTPENAKKANEKERYPITRPLLIYLAGEPTGAIKEYLDWMLSAEGQAIVRELGYVPAGDHD
ncbi:MAG: phosphate ABC transporter substrate-binding protein [Pirellulales bacterium]|nr:phosphate ABC transporter substrate-binding protein [Pirellulales bacterium]